MKPFELLSSLGIFMPVVRSFLAVALVAAAFAVPGRVAAASGGARTTDPGPRRGRDLPRPILYALGDSTAAGVGARSGSYVERVQSRFARAGMPVQVFNLSESGATTSDVIRDQVTRIPPGEARLILMSVGVNDLTRNLAPAEFGRRFEAIVAAIRARTPAPIVVSNLPDVSLAPAVWVDLRPALAARVDAFNAVVERVSRRHGLAMFDICALTRKQLPSHPEYLSADGFHPSDRGYEAWAEGLWDVVQRVL